jgi:hypothetical protein
MPVIAQIHAAGITTLEGIAKELNARNLRPSRGRQWNRTAGMRLLKAKM